MKQKLEKAESRKASAEYTVRRRKSAVSGDSGNAEGRKLQSASSQSRRKLSAVSEDKVGETRERCKIYSSVYNEYEEERWRQ